MSNFVKTRVIEKIEVDINWKGIADAVEALVMAKLEHDLEHWAEDRGMRAMFLCDAGNGVDVAACLAEGDWIKTEKKLWEMDTAARDYVYDYIEQVAGKEFFDLVRK